MADLLSVLDALIRIGELMCLGVLLAWGLVLFTLKADLRPERRRSYREGNAAF
jgi:hypothetical protein